VDDLFATHDALAVAVLICTRFEVSKGRVRPPA
jgi:hypothetical protein